ncbi:MAG TPA: NAD(P)H-quinone oxidoreductase [Myxococcota bacterium]|nr:NAD(P)H-quinone oxidoreductase [Myxococcota bacterium]
MKAIVFDQPGDPSVMKLGDAPAPELRAGAIRIRVAASAVNRADLLQRQGLYAPPAGASPILGLECAGEVSEVAPDVDGWRVGDRAMALLPGGGYAQEVVVEAGCAMRVPDALSLEQAAGVPEVFLTVYLNLFELAALRDGGSALVHGGGSGIGTAAIQLVKQIGGTIVVTAGSNEKCARCVELGADRAVNYRSEDFVEAVREQTGGRGVDAVLDSIGAPYLEQNLAALALEGRLVLIGLMGGASAKLSLAPLLVRRLQLIGSTMRSRSAAVKSATRAAFEARFGAALATGAIRPVIDRVLPLAEAAEAHRVVAASEHFGKVILRVD